MIFEKRLFRIFRSEVFQPCPDFVKAIDFQHERTLKCRRRPYKAKHYGLRIVEDVRSGNSTWYAYFQMGVIISQILRFVKPLPKLAPSIHLELISIFQQYIVAVEDW